MAEFQVIGRRVPKLDAWDKATGAAQYVHDLVLPRMLHARILRSRLPHAEILHIDTSRAKRLAGVRAVLTGADLPGLRFGFRKDNLPLKVDRVRCLGDEVAAVVAVDEETAEEALEQIRVDYRELPPVFDIEAALRPDAPRIHEELESNLVQLSYPFEHGDVEQAFAEADVVVERAYTLRYVTHACLETMGCVASWDPQGGLTIWSTTQVPFLYQKDLSEALGVPGDRIRVIQPKLGGGFGRGLDIYSMDILCALLARQIGRPVKMVYEREEEFVACPTRQPVQFSVKSGARKDGALLAREARVLLDVGAYVSWGATTPYVMMATVTGLYRIPHVKFDSLMVYTNNPSTAAMRGYGNLQATFAVESQMDELARELGMDPLEFRLRNANRPGDLTPQAMTITSCGLRECLETAAREMGWAGPAARRGADGCGAIVKIDDFGKVTLLTGASEIGQGAETALAQITAEELGVPLERVQVVNDDTAITPWDVGVHASRTTFIAGNAARLAAADAKAQLLQIAARVLNEPVERLVVQEGVVRSVTDPRKELPYDKAIRAGHFKEHGEMIVGQAFYDPPTEMQDKRFIGNISTTYTFGTQAAEVEVDIETGEVQVLRVVAAHDVGRAINPLGAEGQIEGGLAMALGYALTEELVVRQGAILNPNFVDYRLITGADMPRTTVILIETDDPAGPFGAKGIGEAGAICTAPAVANAIYDAIGVRVTELPITPERLLRAIRQAGHG
ncbi:MAG: xanthine dehydrogenase family protein molybdopterin-binding subunit [Deltaproteobacteria bacterium]|nr:xanthine dehydrogenase family protein molybdopterin-binding subunit [Deltaproteobacteria bacterium]